jgi:transcription antitermination factor NusG
MWYAIRTTPGAQQPKREFWPESEDENGNSVGGRKGYRIASGINPDYSAVELALKDAAFTYYMPAEFAVVRNRHKRGVYELRRFPLLKGYMFVGDLEDADWPRLMDVRGVSGVVAFGGRPFPVNAVDLFRLRLFEANCRDEAQAKAASLSKSEERIAREKVKLASRNARKKLFAGREVKLIWGDKVGRDATVAAWEDQDHVKVILQGLDAATETITVPYEFLKAAS